MLIKGMDVCTVTARTYSMHLRAVHDTTCVIYATCAHVIVIVALGNMGNCTRLDEADRKGAVLLMGLIAIVSTMVCLLAVILLVLFKLYKYFAHRLALYQVVAALSFGFSLVLELSAIDYYQNVEVYEQVCKLVAFLTVYTVWTKILFMSWINLHLLSITIFNKSIFEKFEKFFILFAIFFPALFVWVPFLDNAYGLAGPWCWIRDWKNNCIEAKFLIGEVEQFTLYYGPAIFASLANIVVIFVIICFLGCYSKCKDNDEIALIRVVRKKRRKALKELLPLLAYPIIFCIILIPPLFARTYDGLVTVKSKNDSIAEIAAFSLSSAFFVPMWSLLPGLALIVHICVLKWPKECCFLCHRQRLVHFTTGLSQKNEAPTTEKWHFTSAKDSFGSCDTAVNVPSEGEPHHY